MRWLERAADRAVSHKLMPASVGLTPPATATPALLKKLAALGADAAVVPTPAAAARRQERDAVPRRPSPPARRSPKALQRALDRALAQLPIPKVMQYQLDDGWTSVSFVRPAHGLVALHGDDVVPVRALGLDAGRTTHGHRFEGSRAPIVLRDAPRLRARSCATKAPSSPASPSAAPRSCASCRRRPRRRGSRRSTTTRCSTRSPRWSSCRTCSPASSTRSSSPCRRSAWS